MSSIRAIVVDPSVAGGFAFKEVEAPQVGPSEALVKVEAISLNRGEAMMPAMLPAGTRLGWDLAGTVIKQAADGTGPKVGSRVMGVLDTGSWAEQVAAPTNRLAVIPDNVTFAQAAALPLAGLTALCALEKGGFLLHRRVLITASTGGVGFFAVQLAHKSGAYIVGVTRHARNAGLVREAGADEVIVGDDLSAASAYGPYHLIVELVGGKTFTSALPLLAPGATCVVVGAAASPEMTTNLMHLIGTGGSTIRGLNMYAEFARGVIPEELAWFAQMVADRQLQTGIEIEASWAEVNEFAQRLMERQITGKAVLHVD
jgi:NADPH:quinone reductase-like Zn-dependent oxidoreductase